MKVKTIDLSFDYNEQRNESLIKLILIQLDLLDSMKLLYEEYTNLIL